MAELVAKETSLVLQDSQIFTLCPDTHLRILQFITSVRYRRVQFLILDAFEEAAHEGLLVVDELVQLFDIISFV